MGPAGESASGQTRVSWMAPSLNRRNWRFGEVRRRSQGAGGWVSEIGAVRRWPLVQSGRWSHRPQATKPQATGRQQVHSTRAASQASTSPRTWPPKTFESASQLPPLQQAVPFRLSSPHTPHLAPARSPAPLPCHLPPKSSPSAPARFPAHHQQPLWKCYRRARDFRRPRAASPPPRATARARNEGGHLPRIFWYQKAKNADLSSDMNASWKSKRQDRSAEHYNFAVGRFVHLVSTNSKRCAPSDQGWFARAVHVVVVWPLHSQSCSHAAWHKQTGSLVPMQAPMQAHPSRDHARTRRPL